MPSRTRLLTAERDLLRIRDRLLDRDRIVAAAGIDVAIQALRRARTRRR